MMALWTGVLVFRVGESLGSLRAESWGRQVWWQVCIHVKMQVQAFSFLEIKIQLRLCFILSVIAKLVYRC